MVDMQDALSVHIIVHSCGIVLLLLVVMNCNRLLPAFSLAGGSEMLNDTHTIRQFLCHETSSG